MIVMDRCSFPLGNRAFFYWSYPNFDGDSHDEQFKIIPARFASDLGFGLQQLQLDDSMVFV
jgi:hypothetical protein